MDKFNYKEATDYNPTTEEAQEIEALVSYIEEQQKEVKGEPIEDGLTTSELNDILDELENE